MTDSIFTKIINGQIPGKFAYQDEKVVAIHDIAPGAPVHILIIPRDPAIVNANDLTPENADIIAHMFLVAKQLAAENGLTERGYRLVMNNNAESGQSVYHMHLHLLGGRALGWPPG